MTDLIALTAALAGGAATKQISKANASEAHKGLAPAVALLLGIAATVIPTVAGGGDMTPAMERGAQIGVAAIGLHSALKNILQLFKKK